MSEDCPDQNLITAAKDAWAKALSLGEKNGYRNAQATVIAPTGTIGLVMDCDTTGIEPDFAMVKFKKLAGGGYFKIINRVVPEALAHLGYDTDQINRHAKICCWCWKLKRMSSNKPQCINFKRFTDREIKLIEDSLESAFDIKFVFNQFTLGEEFCKNTLGISSEQLNDFSFNMLEFLGFTQEEIDVANIHVCGL